MLALFVVRDGLWPMTMKMSMGFSYLIALKNHVSLTRSAALMTFETLEFPVKSYRIPNAMMRIP